MTDVDFKMKVLVVEDDPFSRKYFKNIVSLSGFESFVAENGQEGLSVFKTHDPDVIICDIQMPVMDGLHMLEEVRARHSDAIVIMTTAFDSEEYAIKALELGANNYLKKPVHADNLRRLLSKYNNILKNRNIVSDMVVAVDRMHYRKSFKSGMEYVPMIVEHIIKDIEDLFDDSELIGVQLGLVELVANGVEHGNLNITYEEKSKAIEEDKLEELYRSRLADPEIAAKRITIEFSRDQEACQWIITDEGNGFDWQSVHSPLREEGITKLHGRGIFISRFQFDEMEYLEKGNMVRIRKLINASTRPSVDIDRKAES